MTADEHDRSRPRPSSRYSIFVGVAFLAVIVIAAVNTFESNDGGLLGTGEAEEGAPLPEFAVPELLQGADADANIYQDDCATSENPCPEDESRTPACQVELPNVIRVCDLFDRPLVLSFWFQTPADCPPTQDVVDDAARRHGDRVNFLSLAVRGERPELREIVAERGWGLPIGWDRDGAVSNLMRVGVCPTVAFVREGGVLSEARIGSEELDRAQLEAGIDELIRESARLARNAR